MHPLPYARQLIEQDDIDAVVRVLRGDWLTTGPTIAEFEQALAAYCGARFAVTCSSGTAALHLACLALGLDASHRAIVPAVTFLATANAPRFCGAEVVFADTGAGDALIDPDVLEDIVATHTGIRVLLPVHFAGHPARMELLHAFAQHHKIAIIEDACHALGASYTTKRGVEVRVGSCAHSDMAVFSFHSVKHLAMGEGGAVTTNDPALHAALIRLRSHGIERAPERFLDRQQGFAGKGDGAMANPWYYEMQHLGFNYRLTDIQCALGLSQLAKQDRFLARRRRIAALYDAGLRARLGGIALPLKVASGVRHAYHLYAVNIGFADLGKTRAQVANELAQRGIGTQVHYIPLYRQPYYRDRYALAPACFPGAERYYADCLSLPLFPAMTDEDVGRVVGALADVLGA